MIFPRSIFLLLGLLFFQMCFTHAAMARAGGGSFYHGRQSESPDYQSSPVGQAADEKTTAEALPEETVTNSRETAAQLFKDQRITDSDRHEFRWFGIIICTCLLFSSSAMTICLTIYGDKNSGNFIADRLVPILAINLGALLLAWFTLRGFFLPDWPVFLSAILTAALLTFDGLQTWKRNREKSG